jgi:hypothetical protein
MLTAWGHEKCPKTRGYNEIEREREREGEAAAAETGSGIWLELRGSALDPSNESRRHFLNPDADDGGNKAGRGIRALCRRVGGWGVGVGGRGGRKKVNREARYKSRITGVSRLLELRRTGATAEKVHPRTLKAPAGKI